MKARPLRTVWELYREGLKAHLGCASLIDHSKLSMISSATGVYDGAGVGDNLAIGTNIVLEHAERVVEHFTLVQVDDRPLCEGT